MPNVFAAEPNSLPFVNKKPTALIKDYFFKSDQKLAAWLYLFGIALSIIALTGVMVLFSWWSAAFWGILMAKAMPPFFIAMGQFAVLLTAYVSLHILKNHWIGKLSITWRDWLLKKILNDYLGDEEEEQQNYLELLRTHPEIEGIGQRIQDDTLKFTKLSLQIGWDVFGSILSLGAFAGTLWVLSGPLSFVLLGLNIVIPGYLLWVALAISILATLVTHYIGKSLIKQNQNAEQAESDFREMISETNELAENIAEEHTEKFFRTNLDEQRQKIQAVSNQQLNTQSKLIGFQNFYLQLSSIIPDLFSAPLYFLDLIAFEQLMQISMSFNQVNMALSFLVLAYGGITAWKASSVRIHELLQALQEGVFNASPKNIQRKVKMNPKNPEKRDAIYIKNLTLFYPTARGCNLMRISGTPNLELLSKTNKNQYLFTNDGLWFYDGLEKSLKELDGLPTKSLQSLRETLKLKDNRMATQRDLELVTEYTGHIPAQKKSVITHLSKLVLQQNVHTLIEGPLGSGKSTLFKAIANTWKYGEGKITLPAGKSLYFLPQRPTLPGHMTLKQLLSFPDATTTYTAEEYTDVLITLGMSEFVYKLDEKRLSWKTLSGGEQQVIGIARVLLKKPDMVFLDEATASMDDLHEKLVYETLQTRLKNTTLISISHKKSVRQYHSRIISFNAEEKEEEANEAVISGLKLA